MGPSSAAGGLVQDEGAGPGGAGSWDDKRFSDLKIFMKYEQQVLELIPCGSE